MCLASPSRGRGVEEGGAAVTAELSAGIGEQKNVCGDLCQDRLFQIKYLAQEICSGQISPTAVFESALFLGRCGTELHPRKARADQ